MMKYLLISIGAIIVLAIIWFALKPTALNRQNVDEVFDSAHTVGLADTNYTFLKKIGVESTIIGIGESTHGSKEFNQTRLELFKYLVKNCNYKAFFFEANFITFLPVSNYVETGIGNPELELSKIGEWVWNGQDMLAIVKWMRAYNERVPAAEKVHLLGVDMRGAYSLLRQIRTYFTTHKTAHHQAVLNKVHALFSLKRTSAAYLTGTKELAVLLKDELSGNTVKNKTDSTWTINFCGELLNQQIAVAEVSTTGEKVALRDKFMAANILWLSNVNHSYPKAVFAAHNFHLGNTDNVSGGHIRAALGKKYYSIYQDFAAGTTYAVEDKKFKSCNISGNKSAFSYIFNQENRKAFFLDILTLEKPLKEKLDQSLIFNSIGSVYHGDANSYEEVNLLKQFDGYIYIPRVTARRFIKINTYAGKY